MPILFSASTLATFTLATLALVAAPGPGQALVLTRTFQGGTVLLALGARLAFARR
jgi:hypothetical protein